MARRNSQGNKSAAPRPAPSRAKVQHFTSIVIPTINDTRLVRDCVESIAEHTASGQYEVIVVDDGSPEEVQAALADLAGELGFRLIASRVNQGFSTTCNLGMREATGDVVVLMNNDIVVHAGWLSAMLKCADRSDDIGLVGARLLYPDGSLQHAGVYFDERVETAFEHRFRHGKKDSYQALQETDVVAVTFALVLIKRNVLESVGMMDERLFVSLEDVDYCLTARQAGFRIVYCPKAVATHFEGATRGKRFFDMDPLWVVKQMGTLDLFFSKWSDSDISACVPDLKGFEEFCQRWLANYAVSGGDGE